jgi:hypothetical protein
VDTEEQVRQFQAAQAAQATQTPSGPQAVEVMRKTLDDLRAEQRAGAQRIAAWAGKASTTLVPLGVSPIPVLVRPASISDALPVLDSAADRLRRLDQILGARLEAEGSRLCRSAIEYVLHASGATTRLSPWGQSSQVRWPILKMPPGRACRMLWTWWLGASSGILLTMSSQACMEKTRVPLGSGL